MDRDHDTKLEEAFHHATGLPPPEQLSFIARLKASSPQLAGSLEALLAADSSGTLCPCCSAQP